MVFEEASFTDVGWLRPGKRWRTKEKNVQFADNGGRRVKRNQPI